MISSFTRKNLLRGLAIICCVGMLASCSMLRLGYGQLDTYAAWKANQ
jgi:hypothetical protein